MHCWACSSPFLALRVCHIGVRRVLCCTDENDLPTTLTWYRVVCTETRRKPGTAVVKYVRVQYEEQETRLMHTTKYESRKAWSRFLPLLYSRQVHPKNKACTTLQMITTLALLLLKNRAMQWAPLMYGSPASTQCYGRESCSAFDARDSISRVPHFCKKHPHTAQQHSVQVRH